MMRMLRLLPAALLTSACGGTSTPPASDPSRVASPPTYEVHEWGLVRGTSDDRVMLSGPRAPEPVLAVTKPVLYFHRSGEGALRIDVEARIPSGSVVERWPTQGAPPGNVAAWRGVLVRSDACRGSRYPTMQDEPCRSLRDGCESATLASVETSDSSCLFWPAPPGDTGATLAWNHLFYRGEVPGSHALPIRVEPQSDGSIRLTTNSATPIPGRVLRIRHARGAAGLHDGLAIVPTPSLATSVVVGIPRDPLSSGPAALATMLRDVGLTDPEIDAFARAWNEALFGAGSGAALATDTRGPMTTTTPPVPLSASTSILYVLPADAADALATLHSTPPPTVVRRAIVVWIDETAGH